MIVAITFLMFLFGLVADSPLGESCTLLPYFFFRQFSFKRGNACDRQIQAALQHYQSSLSYHAKRAIRRYVDIFIVKFIFNVYIEIAIEKLYRFSRGNPFLVNVSENTSS